MVTVVSTKAQVISPDRVEDGAIVLLLRRQAHQPIGHMNLRVCDSPYLSSRIRNSLRYLRSSFFRQQHQKNTVALSSEKGIATLPGSVAKCRMEISVLKDAMEDEATIAASVAVSFCR